MTGANCSASMHGIRDSFGLEITRSEVKAQVDARKWTVEASGRGTFVFSCREIDLSRNGFDGGQVSNARLGARSELRLVLINAANEPEM